MNYKVIASFGNYTEEYFFRTLEEATEKLDYLQQARPASWDIYLIEIENK